MRQLLGLGRRPCTKPVPRWQSWMVSSPDFLNSGRDCNHEGLRFNILVYFIYIFNSFDEGIYNVVWHILLPICPMHQQFYLLPTFCSTSEHGDEITCLCHRSDRRGQWFLICLGLLFRLNGRSEPVTLRSYQAENNILRYIHFTELL